MTYFRNFPRINYTFGDESTTEVIENLSLYSDVIDQVRDVTSMYEDYYILPNERPDQLSYKLYGTANYHWTFFLMNTSLRDSGWPLSQNKVFERAVEIYDGNIMTTRSTLTDRCKVGETIQGLSSGTTAKITHRELDLGQLWFKDATGSFTNGETCTSVSLVDGITRSIVVTSTSIQYNAAHHYEDASGNYVDIDPTVGPGAQLTEITWAERLVAQNEELKSIKVIRANIIDSIVDSFREAVAS